MIRTYLLILVSASLVACASVAPPQASTKDILIAPDLKMNLPSLKDFGTSVEATQLITAHYGKDTFVLQSQISITPERVLLVGLDQMGGTLIRITWTDDGVRYQKAHWLPAQLHPENILADFVLVNWPEKAVRNSLSGPNVKLTTGSKMRSVTVNGKEVLHADYNYKKNPWTGNLYYRNIPWKYDLNIQSVEQR